MKFKFKIGDTVSSPGFSSFWDNMKVYKLDEYGDEPSYYCRTADGVEGWFREDDLEGNEFRISIDPEEFYRLRDEFGTYTAKEMLTRRSLLENIQKAKQTNDVGLLCDIVEHLIDKVKIGG